MDSIVPTCALGCLLYITFAVVLLIVNLKRAATLCERCGHFVPKGEEHHCEQPMHGPGST